MTDLAKLTIQINTSGAKTAAENLGGVKKAATEANDAVRDLGAIDDAAFNKLANALASLEGSSFTTFKTKVESAEKVLRTSLTEMLGQQGNADKVKGLFGGMETAALDLAGALELVNTEASSVNLGKAARDLGNFVKASSKATASGGPGKATGGFQGLSTAIQQVGDAALDAGLALLDFQEIKIVDDVDAMKTSFTEFRTEVRNMFRDINRLSKVLGVMPKALSPIREAFSQMATAMGKTRDASDGLSRRLGSIESNAKKLDDSSALAKKGLNELETAFDRSKEAALQYKNALSSGSSSQRATGRARSLQRDIAAVGSAAAKSNSQLRKAAGGVTVFGNASRTAGNFAKQFATGLGFIGPAFAAAIGAREAVATLTDFEYSLRALQAVAIDSNATFDDQIGVMGRLEDQARQLGAATRFTASETAEAQLFLARAGFEANEILAATPATLDLAAAGMLDLGNAADIASNVLQQFSLDAGQLGQVADDLVSAANNSNTTVEQLAAALSYAGPFAASLGITVNEAAAAIGALGNAGIKSTLAGTNFRGILVALTKPTKEAADTMDVLARRLGTTREAFDITKRSVEEVFQSFADANASATELANIFNRRNVSGAQAFITQIDSLKELNVVLSDNTGEARRAADIVDNSLRGAYRRAVSAAQEFVLVQGDNGLKGALRGTVDALADTFRLLSGIKDPTEEAATGAKALVVTFKALAGAVAGLGLGLVVKGLSAIITSISTATIAATSFRAALVGVSTAFPPLLLASVAGSILAVGYNALTAEENVRDLTKAAEDLEGRFGQLLPTLATVGDAIQKAFDVEPSSDPTKSITATANAIQQVNDALKQIESQGDGLGSLVGNGVPIRFLPETEEFRKAAEEQAELARNAFLSALTEQQEFDTFGDIFRDTNLGLDRITDALKNGADLQDVKDFLNRELSSLDVSPGIAKQLIGAVEAEFQEPTRRISQVFRQLAAEGSISANNIQIQSFTTSLEELASASRNRNLVKFANDFTLQTSLVERAAKQAGVPLGEFAELLTAEGFTLGGDFAGRIQDGLESGINSLTDVKFGELPVSFTVDKATAVKVLSETRDELELLKSDALGAAAAIEEGIVSSANEELLQGVFESRDARLDALKDQRRFIGLSKDQQAIEKAVLAERKTLAKDLQEAVEKGAITSQRAQQLAREAERNLRAELELQQQAVANQEGIDARTQAYDRLLAKMEKKRVATEIEALALQNEVDGFASANEEMTANAELNAEIAALANKNITLTEAETAALQAKATAIADNNRASAASKDIISDRAGDDKLITRIEKEIAKRGQAIDALRAENDVLRSNKSEVERFIEASQLSQNATKAQREEYEKLVTTLRNLGITFGQVAGESDKMRQQQQLAQSFNTTLASGFTNIITSGDGAKEAIKNLYTQLIQLVLNQQILSLLQAGGGPSGGAGGFLAGLFGGANYNGGVFSGGSVKQYAKGGIPDFKELPDIGSNFSFFRSGDGKMNSIRERGPEAIVPLARDAQGRLGIRSEGGGGGPRSQTNTINHVQNVTSYNVEAAPDGFGMNSRQMSRQMRRRRN